MDFFVSKVALSICALLVITILSGVTDRGRFMDDEREIESVLKSFCDIADRAYGQRSEGSLYWTMPELSTGDSIQMTLGNGLIRCEWGGRSIVREPQCSLHTWTWDGSPLNESKVSDLDKDSNCLSATSGDCILLKTVLVLFENDHRLLVFACPEFR